MKIELKYTVQLNGIGTAEFYYDTEIKALAGFRNAIEQAKVQTKKDLVERAVSLDVSINPKGE